MLDISIDILTPDDDKLASSCLAYWRLDPTTGQFEGTVQALADSYGATQPAFLAVVTSACIASLPDLPCAECGSPYLVHSRRDYLTVARFPPTGWVCTQCQQEERARREFEMAREHESARARIQASLEVAQGRTIVPSALSFQDAVYLLALVRAAASDDLSYFKVHSEYSLNLSPSEQWDREILDALCARNAIHVHPGSALGSVLLGENDGWRWYPFKVHYLVPPPAKGQSVARFLEELSALVGNDNLWPPEWCANADDLHARMAFEEVASYMAAVLDDYGMSLALGEKTTLMLRELLARFSIGQSFCFIWRAARNASAYRDRTGISRQQAANTLPSSIQRSMELAIAENWKIAHFRRHKNAPETALAQVLFTKALKLPDMGLETIPPPLP